MSKSSRISYFFHALLALTLTTACGAEPAEPDTSEELRSLSRFELNTLTLNYNPNSGTRLNTNNLGEWAYSELALDGSMHNDIALVSVVTGPFAGGRPSWELDDVPAHEPIDASSGHFTLDVSGDNMLIGMTHAGQFLQHADFHDSIWTVQLDPAFAPDLDMAEVVHDGFALVELRLEVSWLDLDDHERKPDPPGGHDEDLAEHDIAAQGFVPVYTFYYEDIHGEMISTCSTVTNPGGVYTESVLYRDVHVDPHFADVTNEPDILEIACLEGAVGKVAGKWGFWPNAMDPGPLGPGEARVEFETAVRALRADYCGDGVSWTQPGQAIQIFDNYWHTGYASYPDDAGLSERPMVEAVWAPGGAACLDQQRYFGLGSPSCGLSACNGKADSFTWLNQHMSPVRIVTRTKDHTEPNTP